jgi:Domain of unknown function (DUF4386)
LVDRAVQTSPQVYARTGGVLYLVIIVGAAFAEIFVSGRLIVSGDAIATATKIMASESLWRIAFAVTLIVFVCDVAVALILYVLLRPVDRNIALLAAFFRLVYVGIVGVAKLGVLAPLLILGGAGYLKAFQPHQLDALAYLSLRLGRSGFIVSLVFFGFHLLIIGYLIFRSGYFPKTIGVLLTIAALSYLMNSFTSILAPTYAAKISPILLLGFVGELSFCLWLLVMGVNVPKWEARARLPI